MKCIKIIGRLKKIDNLINQSRTGTPEEFAKRLNISRSQLYNHIELLKDYGAPIIYSKKIKSFKYDGEFELIVNCNIQFISNNDIIKINAGFLNEFFYYPMLLDATHILSH